MIKSIEFISLFYSQLIFQRNKWNIITDIFFKYILIYFDNCHVAIHKTDLEAKLYFSYRLIIIDNFIFLKINKLLKDWDQNCVC